MCEMEVYCLAALRIFHSNTMGYSDAMGQWPQPDMLDKLGRKVEDTLASGHPVLSDQIENVERKVVSSPPL